MNAWLLLVVAVAAAAWEYYLVYLDSPGHHRRVTAAQAARRRAAARVRVHQPTPGNCSSPTTTPSKPPQSGRGVTVTPSSPASARSANRPAEQQKGPRRLPVTRPNPHQLTRALRGTVMATILPDTPIIGDLSPAQVADLIDQAATLIDSDGLEVGDYWTRAWFQPYEPGTPCCTVGALAAVSGYRDGIDAEKAFVGVSDYDPETGVTEPDHPHLVMATAMKALGFREAEDLYDWSDNAGDREVVAELRYAAAQIRAQAGGVA